ncbi:hypothetical protein SETIT_7G191900v2 [Setaria italica]|uniref:Uncharacterized protein n=1 Tax=Setaria italica TaxID=4555 RepID=K3YB37_SETIT|nr:hypothetical protein SETIT_7G191900v2 [Setaria italica]
MQTIAITVATNFGGKDKGCLPNNRLPPYLENCYPSCSFIHPRDSRPVIALIIIITVAADCGGNDFNILFEKNTTVLPMYLQNYIQAAALLIQGQQISRGS